MRNSTDTHLPSDVNSQTGFTLIEVLIALMILSIALTAIIKSTSQNIKDTFYIQQKTFALYIASDILNEIQAGVTKLSDETDELNETKDMFDQEWPYQANLQKTPNPHIKEINVTVHNPGTNMPLIHLTSYLYEQ